MRLGPQRLQEIQDLTVNALYIYFREAPSSAVTRTVKLEEGVNLDVDSTGRILGLEFVDADDFPKVPGTARW